MNNIEKNDLINNEIEYKENPLEEYDDIIMKNLFIDENENRPDYKKLKENFSQQEACIRYNCLNMVISISETFKYRQETFYLIYNLFDRYLLHLKQSKVIDKDKIKKVLITCIFIATKYEEIYPPFLEDYLVYFKFSFDEIFKLEYKILEYTQFKLHICSPYLFLTKFFSMEKNKNIKIFHGAQFILELCIISIDFCIYKPSLQAAICLYLSKKFFSDNIFEKKILSSEDEFNIGYSEEEIKKKLKLPLKIMKEYFSGNIVKDISKTALFKKYNSNKYSDISKIFKDLFCECDLKN